MLLAMGETTQSPISQLWVYLCHDNETKVIGMNVIGSSKYGECVREEDGRDKKEVG